MVVKKTTQARGIVVGIYGSTTMFMQESFASA